MLLPGVAYWLALRVNPIRCIYGDAACSLTVSTYLLGALTALVFAATLVAALYAKKTFEHERLAALSMQRCTRADQCPHEHRVFYLADPNRGFEAREPSKITPVAGGDPRPPKIEDWGEAGFDCVNVGKAPIVGAVLEVVIPADDIVDAEESVKEVSVGSIASGHTAHLVFSILRGLERRKMEIVKAGHKIEGLEFFPIETLIEPTFSFPAPTPEPPRVGPVNPPAPPPPRPTAIKPAADASDRPTHEISGKSEKEAAVTSTLQTESVVVQEPPVQAARPGSVEEPPPSVAPQPARKASPAKVPRETPPPDDLEKNSAEIGNTHPEQVSTTSPPVVDNTRRDTKQDDALTNDGADSKSSRNEEDD